MSSPRARRVRNGESRCRAPERGSGEVARTAVDEVATADLARRSCDVDAAGRGVCKSIYIQSRVDCRPEEISHKVKTIINHKQLGKYHLILFTLTE
jgi:hypothetical protein